MKMTAESRKEAKKYNAEWEIFEGYNHETGESTYYQSYGVAYRYCNDKARRGIPMSILGHRYDEATNDFETKELITC